MSNLIDYTRLFSAFKEFSEGRNEDGQVRDDLSAFAYWNVIDKLQWNTDYDPDEGVAKFGINVEEKNTAERLFSVVSGKYQSSLFERLMTRPEPITLRVYKHLNRKQRKIIFHEKTSMLNEMKIEEALAKINDLFLPAAYPKPHFHLFKIIWKPGQQCTKACLLEEMQTTAELLQPVMDVLKSQLEK